MNYKVKAKLTIADLIYSDTKIIEGMINLNLMKDLNPNFTKDEFKVNILSQGDLDDLIITGTMSTKSQFSDIDYRYVRKYISEMLNNLCEDQLESVVFEIILLDITY